MPDTNGVKATTRFVDPGDLHHNMHVTIVSFQTGGVLPFAETQVMQHRHFVLEGKAVCRLNQDRAGNYTWLRDFCLPGLLRGRARPVPMLALPRCLPPNNAFALTMGG